MVEIEAYPNYKLIT